MDYQGLLILAPVLLLSVIAHEYAHGYAALKQGDETALRLGRLTWNPVKHIDPWLTIGLPLMLYVATKGAMMLGGAKPVPVNPHNYRNYRRGDIIVSLAGVATNLLIAIIFALLFPLLGWLGRAVPSIESTAGLLQAMMVQGIFLNFALIVFNLIPIPPLDGSHVVKYLLPGALAVHYQRMGFYGLFILVLLMWFTPAVDIVMTPARVAFGWTYQQIDGMQLPATYGWLGQGRR